MRPRGDVLERLAAADPLPDAERLSSEEYGEADALLARLLATPIERAAPRRRLRRLTLVATGALCCAAAAFAAANLLDSDAPGPGVVEKAVAAMTRGDGVYHVLERMDARATGPEPARKTTRMSFYSEYWHTTGGRMHRKVFAVNGPRRGKLLQDMAGRRRPGRRGGPVLVWSSRSNTLVHMGFAPPDADKGAPGIDPFGDPGTRLRELEEQGRLRLAGTTRVGNRNAYRLVSGEVPVAFGRMTESVEFLVDTKTYMPLAEHRSRRFKSGAGVDISTRFLVYERLPLNAQTREQLDLDPHPGASCTPSLRVRKLTPESLGFPHRCAR
jgi:hypothetical protein